MRGHGYHWGVISLVGVLVVGLLALPAAAQDPASDEVCHPDPVGDVRALEDGDEDLDDDPRTDEPRADIVESCFTSGPRTSYRIAVQEPTDASVGDNGEQFLAAWFVLTNSDHVPDFGITAAVDPFSSQPGNLTAQVVDLRGTVDEQTCTLAAEVTDTGVALTDVPSRCLDGAEEVRGEAAMFYFDGSALAYDVTDVLPDTHPEGTSRRIRRLAGADRTGTSVKISRAQFAPGEAATVYLARGDVFADAAVAGVLSDGPILVVPSCGAVPAAVRDEIERLDVPRVTALGGPAAICDALLDAAADGRERRRLGGRDRFETSVRVARAAFGETDRVYLARADDFVDAVTGGTLTDGPILLVPRCGAVPTVVRDAIADYDPAEVVTLGGAAAVCDAALAEAAGGRATGRFAGHDRYHTAILVAQHAFAEPSDTVVYLARADLPVDALAGGVLTDGPILIVPPCGDITTPAFDRLSREINRQAAETVVTLGGAGAVCDDTVEQAARY